MSNNTIVEGFDDKTNETIALSLKKVEECNNCIIISLIGYIDTYNSTYFQEHVNMVIDAGYQNIIFDTEALTYVSSTGIGAFTTFLKKIKQLSGHIIIYQIQAKVAEVFQLLGFAEFFPMKDDMQEIIDFINGENAADVFPKVIICPVCETKLKTAKAGRFRCSSCKSIVSVNETGFATLG